MKRRRNLTPEDMKSLKKLHEKLYKSWEIVEDRVKEQKHRLRREILNESEIIDE